MQIFPLILLLLLTPLCAIAIEEENDSLVEYGYWLKQQQRYGEAADVLERALLLLPLSDQQRIDEVTGSYLQVLEQLNGGTKKSLKHQPKWNWVKDIELKTGWGDNLNQGSSNSEFLLTFPDGLFPLELSDEQKPAAGMAAELQLSVAATQQLDARNQIGWSGRYTQRETSSSGMANYYSVIMQGVWVKELTEQRNLWATAGVSSVGYRSGQPTLQALQSSLRYQWQHRLCRPQVGAEMQLQRQSGERILDGRYVGALLAFDCETGLGQTTAILSRGTDWAKEVRPGGDQERWRVQLKQRLNHSWINKNHEVTLSLSLLEQKDSEGYSDWLSSGARRKVDRIQLGVRDQWSLQSQEQEGWKMVAEINWMKQDSNIEPFDSRTTEVWVGLKKTW